MTAKRFNRVGGYVYDGEKCISHFEDVKHRDDIVKLLNELHEENIELHIQNDFLKDENQHMRDLVNENEQLKSKNLILKGKLHQLRLKCGKQEEEIECLSEETIEKFKQDLQDGNFIEFTAR